LVTTPTPAPRSPHEYVARFSEPLQPRSRHQPDRAHSRGLAGGPELRRRGKLSVSADQRGSSTHLGGAAQAPADSFGAEVEVGAHRYRRYTPTASTVTFH